jgi:hypothetical protein
MQSLKLPGEGVLELAVSSPRGNQRPPPTTTLLEGAEAWKDAALRMTRSAELWLR